jgi:5-methylcytosine-specific restriction endonuclease McrA
MSWRNTREYRTWRVRVIRRDRRCVVCGSIKNRHAHHLNHASYFKDVRFDPENGVCLCRDCHTDFHTNFKRSYKQKCTKYDFLNFVTLLKNMKRRICDA